MMTKEDAKRAVEAELHSQKLTVVEMTDFRQEMYKRLEFKSDTSDWQTFGRQSMNLPHSASLIQSAVPLAMHNSATEPKIGQRK